MAILIAFYSRAGENYFGGTYRRVAAGNTEKAAEMLSRLTGGELLRIDTAVPYSGSYDDVVEQGQREVEHGYEPELKPVGADIDGYDVIAVGTPTWWYTMAPTVRTFLHQNDLRGKTVVPFMTGRRMKSSFARAPFAPARLAPMQLFCSSVMASSTS